MHVCALFVSSSSVIIFNTVAGATTYCSKSAMVIQPFLSPSSMWWTPATESRYFFHEIDWVIKESERTLKFNSCNGSASYTQPLIRQISVLLPSNQRFTPSICVSLQVSNGTGQALTLKVFSSTISDLSVLGKKGESLCHGISTYWAVENCDGKTC